MKVIDLRSDTVTTPTEAMRKAMYDAEVGDDNAHEDPTVNHLEDLVCALLGKEAAILTASGTMSNLVAALAHTNRGDEVIMGSKAHMFWNEAGGVSTLGGVQVQLVPTDKGGRIDPADVEAAIRPDDVHAPRTSLVCLENTHNQCNGSVLTNEDMKAVADVAHAHGLPVHVDGARIFNAAVALEMPAHELCKDVDDVGFCLSKGLSAPVGSMLCGSADFIEEARRWRKIVGGSMRQAGVIAAAGVVAVETMIDRMVEDHAHARRLAEGLSNIPGINVDPDDFQTNIVFVEVDPTTGSTEEFTDRMKEEGVLTAYRGGGRFRLVTHREVNAEDVDTAVDRIAKVASEMRNAR